MADRMWRSTDQRTPFMTRGLMDQPYTATINKQPNVRARDSLYLFIFDGFTKTLELYKIVFGFCLDLIPTEKGCSDAFTARFSG